MTTDTLIAPVLVLGIGNQLLGDDGAGLRLLQELRASRCADPRVEFVDGGTQGIALLAWLAGRRAVLVLDAAALGGTPGQVHVLEDAKGRAAGPGPTVHEGNAGALLAVAELVGDAPPTAALVGIEPCELHTDIGLSEPVERALPAAVREANRLLDALLDGHTTDEAACTS